MCYWIVLNIRADRHLNPHSGFLCSKCWLGCGGSLTLWRIKWEDMKFLLLIFNLLVPVSNFTERICFAPDGWRIEFVLWKSYYQSNTIKKSLDDVEIMKREELNRKRRKIWKSYTRIGDFTWRCLWLCEELSGKIWNSYY